MYQDNIDLEILNYHYPEEYANFCKYLCGRVCSEFDTNYPQLIQHHTYLRFRSAINNIYITKKKKRKC